MGLTSARPGLPRRFASIAYDTLLLCGIFFLAGLPLPLIAENIRDLWWVGALIQAYLIAVCLAFFSWFWVHGGQTLGMRAWRLKVVGHDGSAVTWRGAITRFFSAMLSWAALGFGFWWIMFDPQKQAWHDRLSGTNLLLISKNDTLGPHS